MLYDEDTEPCTGCPDKIVEANTYLSSELYKYYEISDRGYHGCCGNSDNFSDSFQSLISI